jgi:beta-lactamase class A
MPRMARDYKYQPQQNRSTYGNYNYYGNTYPHAVKPVKFGVVTREYQQPQRRRRVKKRTNPIASLVSLIFMCALAFYVIPFGFEKVSMQMFFGTPYKGVNVDVQQMFNPTVNYLSNDTFLNKKMQVTPEVKKPEMTSMYMTKPMTNLTGNLKSLMAQYPTIQPAVFVWNYDDGKYVDINANQIYSTASIIKIPVLIDLFKSIEANQLTIYDTMRLTPYFQADGSGHLKNRPVGESYTIDQLARFMIEESDNTATNMLISSVGSMEDVNSQIRRWGLKNTRINNWLPDIAGTNYSTPKDLATMLYNLDNPGFLNINSREYMVDYMSHVENNRLIQAGIDKKALFIHKTGDIGKMLGDAGIVFAPNGKKYICVILANRPYNSPLGKDFIQKASKMIYSTVTTNRY